VRGAARVWRSPGDAPSGRHPEVDLSTALGQMRADGLTRSLHLITPLEGSRDRGGAKGLVERPMGRDPAQRLAFLQQRASALDDEQIDA
jgi:hypothetical protein